MSEAKPKNDMSKARAALLKKRQEENAKLTPPQVPMDTLPPLPFPPSSHKKRARESSSTESDDDTSEDSSMDIDLNELPATLHPLKAKGVSLEITNVAPKSQKKRNDVVPPKKRTRIQASIQDTDTHRGGLSRVASIASTFGEGVADAIPKLVVMAAGFTFTVAIQSFAARSTNPSHSADPSVLPPAGYHPTTMSPPSNVHVPADNPVLDYPSFISSR